jgi:hypothetical protein
MLLSQWIATTPELAEAFHLAISDGFDAVDPTQLWMVCF